MRFARRSTDSRLLAFEITPMIDVVFLLIIFFMTTARFAQDTKAEVDLPRERGEQEEVSEEAGIVVNVMKDGTIVVAGEATDLDGLERLVVAEAARQPGRKTEGVKLLIRADRDADTAALNGVLSRLQASGVGAARLATEVPR